MNVYVLHIVTSEDVHTFVCRTEEIAEAIVKAIKCVLAPTDVSLENAQVSLATSTGQL